MPEWHAGGGWWHGNEAAFGGGGVAPDQWRQEEESHGWQWRPRGWRASGAPWQHADQYDQERVHAGRSPLRQRHRLANRTWVTGEHLIAFCPAWMHQAFPKTGGVAPWDALAAEAERRGFQVYIRGREPGPWRKPRPCKLHIMGPEKQTIIFYHFICQLLALMGTVDMRWLPPEESISVVPNDATLQDDVDFAGGVAPLHDPVLQEAMARQQAEDSSEEEEEDPDVWAFLNKTGPVPDDVPPAPVPPPVVKEEREEALPQPLVVAAHILPQSPPSQAPPSLEGARVPMGLRVLKEAADKALEECACQIHHGVFVPCMSPCFSCL